MSDGDAPVRQPRPRGVLQRERLGALVAALRERGYQVVGPTLRDNAIVYEEIHSDADLPTGWTEIHSGGRYRVERRDDDAVFGYAVGPDSWKKLFHVPVERLFRAERSGRRIELVPEPIESPRRALFGARSCDLHAIAIQDRILDGGAYADPRYAARRRDVFVVAVQCGESGGTCFCASMGTGPRVERGFDLALTELDVETDHRFLVEVGSDAGQELFEELRVAPAGQHDLTSAAAATERASRGMGRRMDTRNIKELLYDNPEHPRWDQVAERCLACGNCTMVCPTCFCSNIEDSRDLADTTAERVRRWDSCFNLDFSYLHGGAVRRSVSSRYRQWMTHKLASWFDQFDSSGCVGCGRCISWCPVGIDITEEVAAIRAQPGLSRHGPRTEVVEDEA